MRNLTRANKLIGNIAKKHKEITPISLKDISLFEKFFKKEPHTYGNSWTYVTQGMYGIGPYGLGYKYYDGKNLSAVCVYPKLEHPNIFCFYWVRPMGNQILNIIDEFSKDLLKTKSMPTYVKKIFKEQFLFLKKKGFKDPAKFPWYSKCPLEDDSLPELIVDIDLLLKEISTNKKSKRLKRIMKNYLSFPLEHEVKIRDINKTNSKKIWKATIDFFVYRKENPNEYMISREYDFYNMIFYPCRNRLRMAKEIIIGKETVGFYSAEIQSDKTAGIYGVILHRYKYKNLTEYAMIDAFLNLKKKGVKYINLGGSEYQGVEDAKLKYHPSIIQPMYWACLY